MIKALKKFFAIETRQEYIERYLSESVDRVDLEFRERDLIRRGIFY
jgi:hypothetical protein